MTQGNAATAEESAAASEEMNAQAEEMRRYVGNLVALVTGKEGQATMTSNQQARNRAPAVKKAAHQKEKAFGTPAGKEGPKPENVIPLDEDNFRGI